VLTPGPTFGLLTRRSDVMPDVPMPKAFSFSVSPEALKLPQNGDDTCLTMAWNFGAGVALLSPKLCALTWLRRGGMLAPAPGQARCF
jgi:hypothetical protein